VSSSADNLDIGVSALVAIGHTTRGRATPTAAIIAAAAPAHASAPSTRHRLARGAPWIAALSEVTAHAPPIATVMACSPR
jgi:hypothetical protein